MRLGVTFCMSKEHGTHYDNVGLGIGDGELSQWMAMYSRYMTNWVKRALPIAHFEEVLCTWNTLFQSDSSLV